MVNWLDVSNSPGRFGAPLKNKKTKFESQFSIQILDPMYQVK